LRALVERARRLGAWFRGQVPPGTALIVLAVCAAAWALVGLAISEGIHPVVGPLVLLAAATLAEALPVPIEGVTAGATSFSNVFIAGVGTLYGWRPAVIVGALTMLLVEIYRWGPPVKLVYNSSLYVLAGAASGAVAEAVPEHYRLGLASSAAFYFVDVALLCAVVARSRRESYFGVARSFYLSTLPPFGVMAATTAILVRLWDASPYYALLLAPPLVAIVVYQRTLLAAVRRQRELDELKDEFIAVISHELRTPLSSVYGGAVTLEQRQLDDDTKKRIIGIIRHESARLARLVDDVLFASRLDAKKAPQQQLTVDALPIIDEVVETAAELAPPNVVVVADGNGGLPAVRADPEQLRRILANLVDNAVKYSPEGGRVEVSAHAFGERIRFTVTDEGIGIPEEDRERIFEKFTRVDPEMRQGIGGTGLGLYICRELVQQMGGEIRVTSNEGRGSAFIFELPAAVATTA